ncbi:MAG: uracil-DNA glycosylase family protein [Parvularculaceae bacterium]
MSGELDALLAEIRACRHCADDLPHEPRPVLQASATARVAIVGQAPGVRVHASGRPFTDPSGVRLRAWLGLDEATFYDASRVAVAPMGFCFPGLDAKGGDKPPRRECAPLWRARLMAELRDVRLFVLVGSYAQRWHLGAAAKKTLTETVANWRAYGPSRVPTPHPSWRNNAWLKKHPWFEAELLPSLRRRVQAALRDAPGGGAEPSRSGAIP